MLLQDFNQKHSENERQGDKHRPPTLSFLRMIFYIFFLVRTLPVSCSIFVLHCLLKAYSQAYSSSRLFSLSVVFSFSYDSHQHLLRIHFFIHRISFHIPFHLLGSYLTTFFLLRDVILPRESLTISHRSDDKGRRSLLFLFFE